MPLPLALAALAGASALTSGAQAIGNLLPSKYDRDNKLELAKLESLKARGKLGLSPEEQAAASAQQLQPVRGAAEALQARNESLAASTGMSSGADLARLRRQSESTIAQASQAAAQNVQAEDRRAAAAQRAEIEQRKAVAEQRRQDRVQGALSNLAQAASAAGTFAGTVPEALRASNIAGGKIASGDAFFEQMQQFGVPQESMDFFNQLGPEQSRRLFLEAMRGSNDPYAVALRETILSNARANLGAPTPAP